ncbi:MAG: adenylosuccinate synthetase [Planctomycetia bacterium]|nr:adenylosuccinate synthetase [Planctomycetia bacterium]
MKRAVITVGLGFGDEGKGATVDYLVRHLEADLVVRYCGGSQAGHNVQLPDGRRHTFSQFGAGTLAELPDHPRTFLGPAMVIDPLALAREAQHLAELGVREPARLLTIHPRCLVTTPWLRIANQLRELARGAEKHGSCGQGIGEARAYWLKYGADAVLAADLRDRESLCAKLELQRQRLLLDCQEALERVAGEVLAEFGLWELNAEGVTAALQAAFSPEVKLSAALPACRAAIFEGAQGVLLDEYRGFHPYTTWSTVTAHHAWELIASADFDAVCTLGIARAYTTRHGEGPLPTHSPELTARLLDAGNPWNRWQGSLRCGWLDLPLLRYAAAVAGPLDGLVVNHLDQRGKDDLVCEQYRNVALTPAAAPLLTVQSRMMQELQQAQPALAAVSTDGILRALGEIAPVVITGHGATHRERSCAELRFRKRRA